LIHRYLVQPDGPIGARIALFLPAAASHAGVLTAIIAAFLIVCSALPRYRRTIVAIACATFAVLMVAGQADLTVSSITGAPLTPTVFRTFRGIQVVKSNEFLEPLRANWRVTALGVTAFLALVVWMVSVVSATVPGYRGAPCPTVARHRAGRAEDEGVGPAVTLMAGGLLTAWLVSLSPFAVPPAPIEIAFAREYAGLDATTLRAPEADAIAHLRSLVGLPPSAAWIGDRYPLVYAPGGSAVRSSDRPDIVVVMVESLRAEDLRFVTGRGDSVTPALDALAARSVVFTSYLSNAFPSAPSVFAFHASAWPHRRKEIITDFSTTHFDSMPERLGHLGYDTVYVGADPHFDNQDRWLSRWYGGMRDLVASGTQATDRSIVARAIDELHQHDARADGKPLFAFVSTYSTHYPFRLPADAFEPEAPESAGLGARYRQVLHYSDAQIATLLDVLATRSRRDRTVTVVVGDHAFYTNLRKTSGLPENDNEWTAAIVNGPEDLVGRPRHIADPASHVDMLPTILAMVGDRRPTAALGSDLFGARRGAQASAFAIRPGGLRFDRGGYSAIVDARTPGREQIRPSLTAAPRDLHPDLPTADQLNEWVDDWSYLIEHDRVWNPGLLERRASR
jgi:sulfatase-like protein